jgi:nucleotide-binding universal stress UspA family protein
MRKPSFRKLGVAMSFSPRAAAVLTQAARLRHLFSAELIIIHVGLAGESERERMKAMIHEAGLADLPVRVIWEAGDPARAVLRCCEQEGIDLLIAGALKKENLVRFYLGSVARKLLRKATCPVLVLVNPGAKATPFRNIVINAENSPYVQETIYAGCLLALLDQAEAVHVVREIRLMGLTMAEAAYVEGEHAKIHLVEEEVRTAEKLLEGMPGKELKRNVKILSGKSGYELNQFATRVGADLLVTGAPERRLLLLDRVFPHDLEYIFADLPCSLLVVNPRSVEGA